MIPGDQVVHFGGDEYLVKRCQNCDGDVWLLVQNGEITSALVETCICPRRGRWSCVVFEVADPVQKEID